MNIDMYVCTVAGCIFEKTSEPATVYVCMYIWVCMGSGTATGQAPPFRNTLPPPRLLSEQLPGWQERVRWNDVTSMVKVPTPAIGCSSKVMGSYPLRRGPDGRLQRGRFLDGTSSLPAYGSFLPAGVRGPLACRRTGDWAWWNLFPSGVRGPLACRCTGDRAWWSLCPAGVLVTGLDGTSSLPAYLWPGLIEPLPCRLWRGDLWGKVEVKWDICIEIHASSTGYVTNLA